MTGIPKNSTGDKKFYAKWTRNSSGGGIVTPSYPVTPQQPGEGGTVSTDPANAKPGAKVTVTPQPEEGYEVDTVTVTDKDGKEIPVTKNDDGTFSFTMPSGKVTVTATFKEKAHDCPSAKFTDVKESDWFHEYVDYVVEKGLMNGVSAHRFDPNGTLSRAMLATILYRLEGSPAVSGEKHFTDVAEGKWYTDAIAWAREAMAWANAEGLITGKNGNRLDPRGSTTRAEAAAVLMRFCERVVQ